MKRILIALLLLVCVPVFAGVVFQEDFEGYEVGTQMAEQEGWEIFNNYQGNTTVVDNAPNIDSKAMELSMLQDTDYTNYVMVLTPTFDTSTSSALKEVTKISTKVVASSATDIFALYDKNMKRFFYLHMDAAEGKLYTDPAGATFENLNADGETPNEISFVFDHLNNQITSVTCNGETQECLISPSDTFEQPWRLRLSVQLQSVLDGCKGSYYDFVTVEQAARADEPTIFCESDALIPLDSDSAEFSLYNGGPEGEINFTVTSDADWLEVTPASGTFTDTTVLTLKAKEDVEDGFYRCNMTITGGAGEPNVVSVMCSKGNVIFEEKFNDMEDGSIVGQRGWTVGAGYVAITNAYDCNGKCMFTYTAGGNDGCSMYLPKPWYENLVVKVSFDMYWPSESKDITGVCMLQKDSGTNEKFENSVVPTEDGIKLDNIQKKSGSKTIKNFPLAPYDTWIPVEYTIDLQANTLLSFGWDGYITNFSNFVLKNPDCNFYNSYGFAAWDGGELRCHIAVDNLKIERVEREADPTLVVPTAISAGVEESVVVSVRNGGTGSFDFTAEVLDLPDNVTLTPNSGTVEEIQEVTLGIDREGMEDNYYRTRIAFNAGEAGCVTSVVSFVVGGVYYDADFEAPFFELGDFGGQDDWGDDNPGGNIAYILSTNDTQTLMIETGGGYGGYFHDLQVPANNLVRFDTDIFLPTAIFENEDLIGREVIYFKQNSKYSSAADITLDIDFMDGVPIVYGLDHANELMFATTEYAEEWMHVSYVIDYAEGKLVEFTIDDNSDYPQESYINEAYKGAGCNLFCLCVTYQGNIQFDNVKVSVVPEPAVLGFLALLALALIRRK